MKRFMKKSLSIALLSALLLLPVMQVNAAEVSSGLSANAISEMRKAGMSEQDIEKVNQHFQEEIELIESGALDEKAKADQQLISAAAKKGTLGELGIHAANHFQTYALAASTLGTYGDILVAYNASSWGIDFGYPGHAAIVANGNIKTVEAFPADGVQLHTNDWGSRTKVYAMSVKGATGSQYSAAATYAQNQVGKPYNWIFINPWREDAFYCSQLVWKAWKTQGIDVDYITIDPIVTPMEIAKSGNTIIYYSN